MELSRAANMTGVLLKAVSAGRPRQVRLLLDSGISLENTDECGQVTINCMITSINQTFCCMYKDMQII